jgi:hypothetical protein
MKRLRNVARSRARRGLRKDVGSQTGIRSTPAPRQRLARMKRARCRRDERLQQRNHGSWSLHNMSRQGSGCGGAQKASKLSRKCWEKHSSNVRAFSRTTDCGGSNPTELLLKNVDCAGQAACNATPERAPSMALLIITYLFSGRRCLRTGHELLPRIGCVVFCLDFCWFAKYLFLKVWSRRVLAQERRCRKF